MPILAVGPTSSGRALMLGLSFDDVAQMMKGEPVVGSLERSVGIPGLMLMVFVASDEKELRKMLMEAGEANGIETKTLPRTADAAEVTRILEEAKNGK